MSEQKEGRVLVVDDDEMITRMCELWLRRSGLEVLSAHSGSSALSLLEETEVDGVLLDVNMPGLSGVETLAKIRRQFPQLAVVMLTGDTAPETIVTAFRLGANDYLVKPIRKEALEETIRKAIASSQVRVNVEQKPKPAVQGEEEGFPSIVGGSPPMNRLFRELARVIRSDVSVLACGESGTGKELVARAIHEQSDRADGPFVALNCAAIPQTLQESELFGHEKGAFTGATARRLGTFERAHGGTLFLDEVGELSPATQATLLRALQERRFRRVGGAEEIATDFRLVAATHRDLLSDARSGRFREDLYFRIAVYEVEIPPLREREGDIIRLARHFLNLYGGDSLVLSDPVRNAMMTYHWPGNVRELENAVQRAVVSVEGVEVQLLDMPRTLRSLNDSQGVSMPVRTQRNTPQEGVSMLDSFSANNFSRESSPITEPEQQKLPSLNIDELTRIAIHESLEACNGNVSEACRMLGISRTTLYRKMERFGIR